MRCRQLISPLVLVVCVAGCGQSQHGAAPAVTHTVTDQSDPVAAGSAPPAEPVVHKPWYRRGLHSKGFESPTGNIRCALKVGDATTLMCTTLNNKIWQRAILQFGGSSGGSGGSVGGGTLPSGNGYPVMCADGTMSDSGGIQGACSWHGGVAQ
jgi:hypothetical protein